MQWEAWPLPQVYPQPSQTQFGSGISEYAFCVLTINPETTNTDKANPADAINVINLFFALDIPNLLSMFDQITDDNYLCCIFHIGMNTLLVSPTALYLSSLPDASSG